jgi:hypothetical protein
MGEAQPAGGQAQATRPACRLASPLTASVLAGLVVVLVGLLFLAAGLAGQLALSSFYAGFGVLVMVVVIAAVGLVVARSQPGNPIGWLLLGTSLWLLLIVDAGFYATFVYRQGHQGLPLIGPVAVVLSQLFSSALITFPLVILLFPDGRLPSARWRWATWIYLGLVTAATLSVAAVAVGLIAGHRVVLLADGVLAAIEHPAGGTAFLNLVGRAYILTVAVFWLCAVGTQVGSWRRSSGERRQQLKWLASGAAVCGVSGISAIATNSAIWEVLIVGFAALPVSIGVGILKYRLYDIDRIISRTLAYAIVTGLLVGVYVGLVLLTTEVFRVHTPVAVAASTLAAAALFNPLRRRVQHALDRRFNRARYNADETVAAFAIRLKDAVDLNSVQADLAGVVQQALEPVHVSVWLSEL